MTKYKLTTDLIADCMALIPENLYGLNHQQLFTVRQNIMPDIFYDWLNGRSNLFFEELEDFQQFIIISHCLRTIPEFQVENPRLEIMYQELLKISKLCDSDPDSSANWHLLGQSVEKQVLTPKTIASATLHGMKWETIDGVKQLVMMDKPPGTLEELCESYKNIMSKYE